MVQLSFNQKIPTYKGLPIEELDSLGKELDTRYRTNEAAYKDLMIKIDSTATRDINRKHIEAAKKDAESTVRNIVEGGNWEDARVQVTQAASDFLMDKRVRGSIQDKQAYDAYVAEQTERFKKKEISAESYKKSLTLSALQNQDAVEYDEKTGSYKNIFSGYKPVNYQDIQSAMFKLASQWKESKAPIQMQLKKGDKMMTTDVMYDPNLRGYFVVGTKEQVTDAEIQQGLQTAIMANPEFKSYINEQTMLDAALKFGVGENKRKVTPKDIISSNPEDGALLNMSEDDFRTWLKEKQGMDYDKILAEYDNGGSDFLEGLWASIHAQKQVAGYITPAHQAYSYEKIDHDYLTDNVALEAMKHANKMKEKQYDWAKKFEFEAFTRKEEPARHFINNEGIVTTDAKIDLKARKDELGDKKAELAIVKNQLELHKQGKGTGNFNELTARMKTLQSEVAARESFITSVVKTYKSNPEYKKDLMEKLKVYNKIFSDFNKQGAPLYSFNEADLEDILINGTNSPVYKRLEAAYKRDDKNGLKTNAFAAVTSLAIDGSKGFLKDAEDYVKENGFNSTFGVVVEGEKGTELNKLNDMVTTFVNNNRTNMMVVGSNGVPVQLDQYLSDLEIEEENISIRSAVTDGKLGKDTPLYTTIVDKKTGKTVSQVYLIPKIGGDALKFDAGEALIKQSKPGSEYEKRGWSMVADATFTSFDDDEIGTQVGSVKPTDPPGTNKSSTVFTVPSPAGELHMKVQAARYNVYDNNGRIIGTNLGYKLIQVNPTTGEDHSTVIPSAYIDQKSAIDAAYNAQSNGLSPMERSRAVSMSDAYTYYPSIQDAKVDLYKRLYPETGKKNFVITGGATGKSEANGGSKKPAEATDTPPENLED